ncbi:flagellar hook protein FlgE [Methylobacterium sp. ID0610]|uniref:flagellar hook protein FlgE n=1 Tax=Methylobacterium carpenticola TaxID=3344827 RepID=UPI0036C2835C
MSLLGALRTGTSGMNAQSNRISTIAENVQNAGTTGYKKVSTEFSSLLIEPTAGGNYNSGAVDTVVRRQINGDGPTSTTNSGSDLAISGDGFFVVRDSSNVSYLTRAGNFVKDGPTGNYKNAAGFTLMGYSLANGEPVPTVNSLSGMVPVNVETLGMKAKGSTTASFTGNLDSTAAAVPAADALPTGAAYTKKTSVETYDTLGKAIKLDVYLTKTDENKWTALVYDASVPGSFPATPMGTTNLTFTDGKLPAGTTVTLAAPTGSTATITTVNLSALTQNAATTSFAGKADGFAASAPTSAEFAADGTVYAVYEDGSKVAAFKVPLATVASPDNLTPKAGNVFETSNTSGTVQVGFAGQPGFGNLKTGALEQSNVDVSAELTAMIESQTVYTANSKVFMTSNEMLDTLMTLKR